MLSYADRVRQARGRSSTNGRELPDGFREEFPMLADVLAGVADDGTGHEIGAATVTLFVKDGRLRFSIGGQDADVCFFGECEDAAKGLWAIEDAIREGRLGVKEERRKK
jgi:hypothetical protein